MPNGPDPAPLKMAQVHHKQIDEAKELILKETGREAYTRTVYAVFYISEDNQIILPPSYGEADALMVFDTKAAAKKYKAFVTEVSPRIGEDMEIAPIRLIAGIVPLPTEDTDAKLQK